MAQDALHATHPASLTPQLATPPLRVYPFARMGLMLSSPPQRILIIKPSAIGDVVHTLPILNLLRHHYPQAHIAWLVTPACAGILEDHPQLDQRIVFDRKALSRWWRHWPTWRALQRFTRALREQHFDLVLDLQGLFRSAWLAWATRAPVRVGFANAREGAPLFYTHRVRIDSMEQHAIERYRKLLAFIGCPTAPIVFPFPTDAADRACIAELAGDQPYAVVLPGTNWPTKRWPVERFAALVPELKARFGLATIVAGSPAERELGQQVPGALNLCGQTSLRQLVALLERAAVVIANDSGPMHIAAALGRPLVTLFGPTNPIRTGPYQRLEVVIRLDIACSPCYSRTCSHQSCLQQLPIDPVLVEIERQIGRHPASAPATSAAPANPGASEPLPAAQ